MKYIVLLLINYIFILINISHVACKSMVPLITLDQRPNGLSRSEVSDNNSSQDNLKFLPFIMLIDKDMDTSEYWRETEILSLVRNNEVGIDYDKCEQTTPEQNVVHINSLRSLRPICRSRIGRIRTCAFRLDSRYARAMTTKLPRVPGHVTSPQDVNTECKDYQLCPQCPHFNNHTECELFRDSCKERRVNPSEYRHYCDRKYGKWRAMFVPADYSQCRCCDECIFYRELDQSCVEDEYSFETEEFLPIITIDFRAGCNPYWGHPEQEFRALRCDKVLRRCVPVSVPQLPNETLNIRRSYRYEPTTNDDCPLSCHGFMCSSGLVKESDCVAGGFLPDKNQCNCCGRCSFYHQLNEKCAEFKKTIQKVNDTVEIEVEEEFLEPGCDDGLVCRQGRCQDIHTVRSSDSTRRKREEQEQVAHEPCKRELKYFKKKYGPDGHLHYNAPQCTPLWLFAPVQCRRFVCYCALEDGTFIIGIKVPRVEVSNMNCDCARERCRTGSDVECDGYGNYKEAVFTPHLDDWKSGDDDKMEDSGRSSAPSSPEYMNPTITAEPLTESTIALNNIIIG